MLDLDGKTEVVTANITMDPTTGIGNRTEQEFVEAVRFKKPGGGQLHYPMTPHAGPSDTEVRAIYAYLKTVPQIHHEVTRFKELLINSLTMTTIFSNLVLAISIVVSLAGIRVLLRTRRLTQKPTKAH